MNTPSSWAGKAAIRGSSESMRMALLTTALIGLQFTWGIEMTYCTPYLLQLGLTKSRTSLVWIAGPLSGLIMQPIVGAIADRSTSRWGRRRPFMIGGSVVVAVCLMVLGWTAEIVELFCRDEDRARSVTILVAVLTIYATDFAINAVQASARSLIVDTLPISKQQQGSAWASRMTGAGHLVGYAVGSLNLEALVGDIGGDSQLKKMALFAALGLLITVGITSWSVEERRLLTNKGQGERRGAIETLRLIVDKTLSLPPRIRVICWTVFWSWIGWFPFLFYSSTWVGETYFRYAESAHDIQTSDDPLGDVARIGSSTLVLFSVVSLTTSVILPKLVKGPDDDRVQFTKRPPPALKWLLTTIENLQPDLNQTWFAGHLVFFCTMIFTPLVKSSVTATALATVCGLSWAVTCWAPFAFMGIEINRLDLASSPTSNGSAAAGRPPYSRVSSSDSLELESRAEAIPSLHLSHSHEETQSTGELSGVYLGILNLFTTLPQFVGTFISTCVFAIFEPGKSPELAQDAHPSEHHATDGPNAIAICLAIGALSNLVAAYSTYRLRHTK